MEGQRKCIDTVVQEFNSVCVRACMQCVGGGCDFLRFGHHTQSQNTPD